MSVFINRELSWIEFNARILHQAQRDDIPVMERLKFLGITASNFNEFFMIRVAGLKRLALDAKNSGAEYSREIRDAARLTPKEQLALISKRAHELSAIQSDCLNNAVLPLLKEKGIVYVPPERYSPAQREFTTAFFSTEIFPLLTPLRLDALAFPRIANLNLHAAFLLRLIPGITPQRFDVQTELFPDNKPLAALAQIPTAVSRVVELPRPRGEDCEDTVYFALLDDIITQYGTMLFPGYSVDQTLLFRLTRDADFSVDEESGDFIGAMKEILVKRMASFPVRLSCNDTSPALIELLKTVLELSDDDVYVAHGVGDASSLQEIARLNRSERLFFSKWKHYAHPDFSVGADVWDTIKMRDVLLHTPYQSYDAVVSFISNAAVDDSVLAIKMTLYRTSGSSPIIDALEKAAQNGKQVTVFVELKARFNEKQNIEWAERLERAGVVVVYGIVNLKVHAKALLVIRRESAGIKRYAFLSTGNFNEETAKTYSDLSVFTADNDIANDVILFFNIISGYSALQTMKYLYMSPAGLKDKIVSMIEREIACSTPENPGLVIAKMNSLSHEGIINALYKAARAGVRIKLNVRGICMLVPKKNIEVTSVIDRYLEHARVFYFWNGGSEELYLSSADWMPRNLDRRVELMFPAPREHFSHIKKILDTYFSDNQNAFTLTPDGTWIPVPRAASREIFCAQESLQHLYQVQARTVSASGFADDAQTSAFVVRRKS
jgi:polyphosphate kinase